ncbi:MAG: hypothetical protein JXB10_19685 [Pirellulales bacterium]|nr:hypothetical protein [Pirellulales bacterium]
MGGCAFFPKAYRQPQFHNPFPQLSTIAIAPFINLSDDPTLDGRKVALAYANELQVIPGFEVVPVGIVEMEMRKQGNQLTGPEDARRLAQALHVDAIVIGSITDYSSYYPPRMALEVLWYAANPGYHPIPPGYGLPWGTLAEKEIPAPLVLEAEMALAKAQLKTQTPKPTADMSPPKSLSPNGPASLDSTPKAPNAPNQPVALNGTAESEGGVQPMQYIAPIDATGTLGTTSPNGTGFPPDWPDPKGFVPPGPRTTPPPLVPTNAPVLEHVRTYNGNDMEFTTALSSYYDFRDDARSGGWQSYLQRSDDFIRFCCHMHIAEMLSARGGAGESRVTWRWPIIR